jgi:calcineurin-like phosphoesterase family protein
MAGILQGVVRISEGDIQENHYFRKDEFEQYQAFQRISVDRPMSVVWSPKPTTNNELNKALDTVERKQ